MDVDTLPCKGSTTSGWIPVDCLRCDANNLRHSPKCTESPAWFSLFFDYIVSYHSSIGLEPHSCRISGMTNEMYAFLDLHKKISGNLKCSCFSILILVHAHSERSSPSGFVISRHTRLGVSSSEALPPVVKSLPYVVT
jgi:hypothetical protein